MNREIKFRAWYDKSQSWVYFNFNEGMTSFGYSVYKELILSGSKFYQYTGLKDVNGKEIYEGDVVIYPNPRCRGIVRLGFYEGGSYDTYEHGNGFYFEPNLDFSQTIGALDSKDLTVIGNIYENPELL